MVTSQLPGGGEQRTGQVAMAEAVAEAIASVGHTAIQAGTGTGKSLAYLVPAVMSDQRVVVATATKALQDQLAGKDLPFLAEHLDLPFRFAVLKGRSNYLCLQRLDELDSDNSLSFDSEADGGAVDGGKIDEQMREVLLAFAADSATGDRAELDSISDRAWSLVSVARDECPGAKRCPRGDDCFAEKARDRAAQADIIVVNLHLYALAITTEGILPDHGLVVIDEAHQLEDIVAEAAGRQISPARVQSAARATASVVTETEPSRRAEDVAVELRSELEPLTGTRLPDGPDAQLGSILDDVRTAADRLLNALRAVPESAPAETRTKAMRARQIATGLIDDIDAVRWPNEGEVLWVDGPGSNPSLRSTPIAIDELLAEKLWPARSGVLTSATLAANSQQRLGLPESATTLDVGSPFDHRANALLYCPAHLPDPRSDDFRRAQHAELEQLMVAAGGRTLALFTSYSAMREAAEYLDGRLPWELITQGDGAKNALLRQFIDNDETSLFATMSFWQGVDAPGSTCRLVTIDRIPFPRPDEPVLQARRDRAGRAAFRTIDLPRAATLLAQGVGRLLRTATDKGVVAVLDPRLANARSYRWDLINSLPPMQRTKDLKEAVRFLQELRDSPNPSVFEIAADGTVRE